MTLNLLMTQADLIRYHFDLSVTSGWYERLKCKPKSDQVTSMGLIVSWCNDHHYVILIIGTRLLLGLVWYLGTPSKALTKVRAEAASLPEVDFDTEPYIRLPP